MEALLAGLAALILPALPRRWIVGLSKGLGQVAFRFARRDRRIAVANVELVFGAGRSAAEKRRIVIESFQTMTLMLLDLFWFQRRTACRLRRHVFFDASYHYFCDPKSCVGVTAHYGNWEVMGLAAALKGDVCHSVAMPLKNPYVDRILSRSRRVTGQQVMPRKGAVKTLLRVLRSGGRAAFLMDQNTLPSEGGQFIPFFGRPVPVSGAAELLARRTGAAVIFAYTQMDKAGDYHVKMSPALAPGGRDDGADAGRITRETTAMLEQLIRGCPGQWLWMYKRWKFVPPGQDRDRYPYYARLWEPEPSGAEKQEQAGGGLE
jgi:Kdo2-lipid IVA lauroyltransferase/acyltransferase